MLTLGALLLAVTPTAFSKALVNLSDFGFRLRVQALPSNLTRLREVKKGEGKAWAVDDRCDGNSRSAWFTIEEKKKPQLHVFDEFPVKDFSIRGATAADPETGVITLTLDSREKLRWRWVDQANGVGELVWKKKVIRYVKDSKATAFPKATELTGECRPPSPAPSGVAAPPSSSPGASPR